MEARERGSVVVLGDASSRLWRLSKLQEGIVGGASSRREVRLLAVAVELCKDIVAVGNQILYGPRGGGAFSLHVFDAGDGLADDDVFG